MKRKKKDVESKKKIKIITVSDNDEGLFENKS
jgi:hypothetical protein